MKKAFVVTLSYIFLHTISLKGSESPKQSAAALDLSSWVAVSFENNGAAASAAGTKPATPPAANAHANQAPTIDTSSHHSPAQSLRSNPNALSSHAEAGATHDSACPQLAPLTMPPLTPTSALATISVLGSNPTATPSATPHAAQPQIAAPPAAAAPVHLTAAKTNLAVPQLTRTRSGRALDAAAVATSTPTTIVHGSPRDIDLEAQKQSSESIFARCLKFLSCTCCSSCPPCPPLCKTKD